MNIKETVYVKELDIYVDRLEDYIEYFGTQFLFRIHGNGLPKGSRYMFIDPHSYYYEIDGISYCLDSTLEEYSKTIMLGL